MRDCNFLFVFIHLLDGNIFIRGDLTDGALRNLAGPEHAQIHLGQLAVALELLY